LLRVRGGQTVPDLVRALRLTRTAVLNHLAALQAQGFVQRQGMRRGTRRPSVVYEVTPAADALFPKKYEAFAAAVLDALSRNDPSALTRRASAGSAAGHGSKRREKSSPKTASCRF
jgi:predicted ArsR family transcriptional regulator